MSNFQKVRQFRQAFGLSVADRPGLLSPEEFNLHLDLAEEEYDELLLAVESSDLVGIADAITDLKYILGCAGNGEIVTDWPTYLHPPEGSPADAGTADCPDCGGSGKASSDAEGGRLVAARAGTRVAAQVPGEGSREENQHV